MNRRAKVGVRVFGAAAFFLSAMIAAPAMAQTTVVLDSPDGEVVDAFIRAGDYANTVYNSSVLQTKANSNSSFRRRALLKFDTQNFVPENASIQSATLTVTLKSSESSTRTLGAYRVSTSFDESAATWYRRKTTGDRWTSSGGDLGSRYATATVGTSGGTRVTFNVTSLVQSTVRGNYGSRYTRIALIDEGGSSASSLKQFHSSESSDVSARPKLTVVYGSSNSAPPPPPPPNDPTPTSGGTLKVMHWNIHYGLGTNGVYGLDKYVDWIVRINPDVVSLNEVEKNVPGHGNEDQPALLASKLRARTGRTWYYHHANRWGNWGANGGGNLILSRYPILARAQLAMSYDRSAALATIEVNGRTVNVVSTHLASESSGYRATQIRQLMPWLRGFSEQRIVAGDFNAGLVNVPYMEDEYNDGWMQAVENGTATDYAGNSRPGATHTYKIDFIFESEGASRISVRSARVYDTRDAHGVRPSDHKPLMVTFNIN
jgi:endonuclease/exonuclease/phosphatase family metal-dependent hydrolase